MDFAITSRGVMLDRRKLKRLVDLQPTRMRDSSQRSGAEADTGPVRDLEPFRDKHPLHRIVFLGVGDSPEPDASGVESTERRTAARPVCEDALALAWVTGQETSLPVRRLPLGLRRAHERR